MTVPCEKCPVAGAECLGPGLGLCRLAGVPAWDRHIVGRSCPRPAALVPAVPPPSPARALAPPLDEWTYVATERLIGDTTTLLAALPPDVDAVVAIARSGLIPGQVIACSLHLPLWTVSSVAGVLDPGSGVRMGGRGPNGTPPRRVLLVDDTAARGGAMARCGPIVAARFPGSEVTRAVVYCHPLAAHAVDLCVSEYPGLHYLEWNWANAGHGAAVCLDFDGVISRDFTPEECATDASYRAAMATIEPLSLPRRLPVPLIVTARPESTRRITEDWLRRWGVRWDRLVMWAGNAHPDNEEAARFKSRHYAASACALMAESDPCQARLVNEYTRKPVLCPALGRVLPPPGPKVRVGLGEAVGAKRGGG